MFLAALTSLLLGVGGLAILVCATAVGLVPLYTACAAPS